MSQSIRVLIGDDSLELEYHGPPLSKRQGFMQ